MPLCALLFGLLMLVNQVACAGTEGLIRALLSGDESAVEAERPNAELTESMDFGSDYRVSAVDIAIIFNRASFLKRLDLETYPQIGQEGDELDSRKVPRLSQADLLRLAVLLGNVEACEVLLAAGSKLVAKTILSSLGLSATEGYRKVFLETLKGNIEQYIAPKLFVPIEFSDDVVDGRTEKLLDLLLAAPGFQSMSIGEKQEIISQHVENDRARLLSLLLKRGFLINAQEKQKLFLSAARYGDLEQLQLALQMGGDPNIANSDGEYALELASADDTTKDPIGKLRILVDAGAVVHEAKMGGEGKSALLVALRARDASLVRILMQRGANPLDLQYRGEEGFRIAISNLDVASLKAIIEYAARSAWETGRYNSLLSDLLSDFLWDGARRNLRGDNRQAVLDIIRILVEAGADVNRKKDERAPSPIQHALSMDEELFHYFLQHKARTDELHEFALKKLGTPEALRILQRFGISPPATIVYEGGSVEANFVKSVLLSGKSAFIDCFFSIWKPPVPYDVATYPYVELAAESASVNALHYLVSVDAPLDTSSQRRQTPLSIAIKSRSSDFVNALFDYGLNPTATDTDGRNGLHALIDQISPPFDSYAPLMRILLARGVDPFLRSRARDLTPRDELALRFEGNTELSKQALAWYDSQFMVANGSVPLSIHDAIRSGQIKAVRQALSQRPDDVNQADGGGATPLQLAVESKIADILAEVLASGAILDLGSVYRPGSVKIEGIDKDLAKVILPYVLRSDVFDRGAFSFEGLPARRLERFDIAAAEPIVTGNWTLECFNQCKGKLTAGLSGNELDHWSFHTVATADTQFNQMGEGKRTVELAFIQVAPPPVYDYASPLGKRTRLGPFNFRLAGEFRLTKCAFNMSAEHYCFPDARITNICCSSIEIVTGLGRTKRLAMGEPFQVDRSEGDTLIRINGERGEKVEAHVQVEVGPDATPMVQDGFNWDTRLNNYVALSRLQTAVSENRNDHSENGRVRYRDAAILLRKRTLQLLNSRTLESLKYSFQQSLDDLNKINAATFDLLRVVKEITEAPKLQRDLLSKEVEAYLAQAGGDNNFAEVANRILVFLNNSERTDEELRRLVSDLQVSYMALAVSKVAEFQTYALELKEYIDDSSFEAAFPVRTTEDTSLSKRLSGIIPHVTNASGSKGQFLRKYLEGK